jgi:hypothetical protein
VITAKNMMVGAKTASKMSKRSNSLKNSQQVQQRNQYESEIK